MPGIGISERWCLCPGSILPFLASTFFKLPAVVLLCEMSFVAASEVDLQLSPIVFPFL